MNKINSTVFFILYFILVGCGVASTNPPIISDLSFGSSIVMNIPDDLSYNPKDRTLYGVKFIDTLRYYRTSNNIRDMIGIKFSLAQNELVASKINGELFSSGTEMLSSITYKILIHEEKNDNSIKLTLTPYQKIETQGRDPLFIPYKMPVFSDENLIENMRTVSFKKEYEFNSKYSTDSIRGNFERLMKKMDSDKRPDYVKLTEAYSGKTESCNVDLWVGFFPYQDGSKTTILSSSECKSNTDYFIDVVNFEKQIQDYIIGIINN